jgi:hypothetical protein
MPRGGHDPPGPPFLPAVLDAADLHYAALSLRVDVCMVPCDDVGDMYLGPKACRTMGVMECVIGK